MSWQSKFLQAIGPGLIPGITAGNWCSILKAAKFQVSPKYLPRAGFISGASLLNSAASLIEKALYSRKIKNQIVEPPVFILGCWRSGTTHLQNLLSHDQRYGFPNLYQTLFPDHFLYSEKLFSKPIGCLVPKTRPQDNVKLAMDQPSEEEIGLVSLSTKSHLVGDTIIPRQSEEYAKYLTLEELDSGARNAWKSELEYFIKKLAVRHQKPLMLKSPGHTARIELLMELYPDAKFIKIHRHPFSVVKSGIGWLKKTRSFWSLQSSDNSDVVSVFLRNYRLANNAYFEQRHLIPEGRLIEIGHSELESDPMRQLQRIYDRLELPSFAKVADKFQDYVASTKNYQKNEFKPLPESLRSQVIEACPDAFDIWGYDSGQQQVAKAA